MVTSAFHFIEPRSPILAKAVPIGPDWIHEVKFDGQRVQAHKVGGDVVIFSRNGHNFTERFAPIAYVLRHLPAGQERYPGRRTGGQRPAGAIPTSACSTAAMSTWALSTYGLSTCWPSTGAIGGPIPSGGAKPACRRCSSASTARPSYPRRASTMAWRCSGWPRNGILREW